MELCGTPSDSDAVISLAAIVETVNTNSKSTWRARHMPRFDKNTRKELQTMLGTVVDPKWVIKLPD